MLRRLLVSVISEVERVCREVVIAGAFRVLYLFSQAEESHKLSVDFPARIRAAQVLSVGAWSNLFGVNGWSYDGSYESEWEVVIWPKSVRNGDVRLGDDSKKSNIVFCRIIF